LRAAVGKITDEALLTDLARSGSVDVRQAVIPRLAARSQVLISP
jgi:hypothetical protein